VADRRESFRDPGALTAGYERLREAVQSGGAGGWRLGHGVLSARGLVGWMNAFGSLAPPPPVSGAQTGAVGHEQAVTLPLPEAGEVVAVLAQMTLALAA
jgi:hypothetical protein